jgi:hypothetical protein
VYYSVIRIKGRDGRRGVRGWGRVVSGWGRGQCVVCRKTLALDGIGSLSLFIYI